MPPHLIRPSTAGASPLWALKSGAGVAGRAFFPVFRELSAGPMHAAARGCPPEDACARRLPRLRRFPGAPTVALDSLSGPGGAHRAWVRSILPAQNLLARGAPPCGARPGRIGEFGHAVKPARQTFILWVMVGVVPDPSPKEAIYSAAVETSSASTSVSVIPSGTACNPTPPRSSRAASAASSSAASRGGNPNMARASSSEIVGSPVV